MSSNPHHRLLRKFWVWSLLYLSPIFQGDSLAENGYRMDDGFPGRFVVPTKKINFHAMAPDRILAYGLFDKINGESRSGLVVLNGSGEVNPGFSYKHGFRFTEIFDAVALDGGGYVLLADTSLFPGGEGQIGTYLLEINSNGLVEETRMFPVIEKKLICPLNDGSFIHAIKNSESNLNYTIRKSKINGAGEVVEDLGFQPIPVQGMVLQVERLPGGGFIALTSDNVDASNAQLGLISFDTTGMIAPSYGQDESLKTLRYPELFVSLEQEVFLLAQDSIRRWYKLTSDGRLDAEFQFDSRFLINQTRLRPIPGGGYYLTGDILDFNGQYNPSDIFRLEADGSMDPDFDYASLSHLFLAESTGVTLVNDNFISSAYLRENQAYELYSLSPDGLLNTVENLVFEKFEGFGVSEWTPTGELLVSSFENSPRSVSNQIEIKNLVRADGSVRARLPPGLSFAISKPVWIQKDGRWLTVFDYTSGNPGLNLRGLIRFDESGTVDDQFITYYQDCSILGLLDDGRIMVQVITSGDGDRKIDRLLQDGTPDPDYQAFEYNDHDVFLGKFQVMGDGTVYFLRALGGGSNVVNKILSDGGLDALFSTTGFQSYGDVEFVANESGIFLHEPGMFVNGQPKPFGIKFSLEGVLESGYAPENQLETEYHMSYSIGGNNYADDGSLFVIAKAKNAALMPVAGYPLVRIAPDGSVTRISGEAGWNRVSIRPSAAGDVLVIGEMYSETNPAIQKTVRYTREPIPYSYPLSEVISLTSEPIRLEFTPSHQQGISYRWLKDGVLLPGQLLPSISFPRLLPEDAGLYQLEMRLAGSVYTTHPINLLAPYLPTITQSSGNIETGLNGIVEVFIQTAGLPTPEVEWQKDGIPLDVPSVRLLRLSNIGPDDAGVYRARIYNELGEVWSDPFVIEPKGFFPERINTPEISNYSQDFNEEFQYYPASDGAFWMWKEYSGILYRVEADGTLRFDLNFWVEEETAPWINYWITSDGTVYAKWREGVSEIGEMYAIRKIKPDGMLDEDFGKWQLTVLSLDYFLPLADGSLLLNIDGVWRKFLSSAQEDLTFHPIEGNYVIQRNDALSEDGAFFLEDNNHADNGLHIVRYNADGTPDEQFLPYKKQGSQIVAYWPDGKLLLYESFWGNLSLRMPDGSMRFENVKFSANLPHFYHPGGQGSDKVYILNSFVDVGQDRGLQWIDSEGNNSFSDPVRFEDLGTIFSFSYFSPDRLLIAGSEPRDELKRRGVPKLIWYNPEQRTSEVQYVEWFEPADFPERYAVSEDGGLFLSGDFIKVGAHPRDRLVKLNEDGTVDTSFDPNEGMAGLEGKISRLIPTPSDGGVIAGFQPLKGVPISPDANSYLVKFDVTGAKTATIQAFDDNFIQAVCLLGDRSIIYSEGPYFSGKQPLKKVLPNGSVDAEFLPPEFDGRIFKLHPGSDGRFYVEAEEFDESGYYNHKLVLLGSDGALDPSFVVPAEVQVLDTFMDGDENLWGSIEVEYWDEVVRFELNGAFSEGFPQRPDWPFSVDDMWFFQDGSAIVTDNTEAYGLNPDGTGHPHMPRGFFSQANRIFGTFNHSIYARAEEGPLALEKYSLQSSPIVWVHPESRSASLGGTTTFSITPWSNDNYSFQWLKNGVPITGATEASLSLTDISQEAHGLYSVVLTLGALSRESHPAELKTHRFDGFPVNAFPLSVEKMESGHQVIWTSEAGYGYVLELSRDMKVWVEDARPLLAETNRMTARFTSEELKQPLFVRVKSVPVQ